MKRTLLLCSIVLPLLTIAQNWQTTNGPRDRTKAIGIFRYQDFLMISGSCSTFISADGETYSPLRYDNSTSNYTLFNNKVFFTYNGGTESLYYNGTEWTKQHVDYYKGIDLDTDPDYIYRVVNHSGIQRSSNGTSWTELNDGLPSYWLETGPDEGGYIYDVLSINAGEDYLFCGTDTGVYRTNRDLIDWEFKNSGLPDSSFTEIESKGDTVFAVSNNNIYRTIDAAESWDLNLSLLEENNVNKIEIINDTVFILTKTEGLFLSTNFGETWTTINNGLPSLDVTDIFFEDTEYYIAGTFGVFKGLDNWVMADRGAICSYNYAMDISQDGIASTQGDQLYYLGEDSLDWTNISPDMPIWFINDIEHFEDKIITSVETSNIWETPVQLLESYDNGLTWDFIHEFEYNYRTTLDHSNGKISAIRGDQIYLSSDGGYTWALQSLPSFPDEGVGFGVTTTLFSDDYWFIGRPPSSCRIDRTNDGGASWNLASIGLPWGRITGLWEFNDTLFTTNYSGLFYSTNNSESWNQCGRGIPGEIDAMIEWEGKYFVAAGKSVYFSEDGGVSFNIISQGLPHHQFGNLNSGKSLLKEYNDVLYFGSHYYGVYKLNLNDIETYLSINEDLNTTAIYPNPSNNGFVTLQLPQSLSTLDITILNTSGAIVKSFNFYNKQIVSLDLSNLKGVYFVQIDTGNDVSVEKIVLN